MLKRAVKTVDYRRVLCVWLRVVLSLPAKQISLAVGLQPGTVRRLQSDFGRLGSTALLKAGRGGAHHRYLTDRDERTLVSKYRRRTRYGEPFNVQAFRTEFERRVGKPVASSTIYRLLQRHGCRRLLPRARSRT